MELKHKIVMGNDRIFVSMDDLLKALDVEYKHVNLNEFIITRDYEASSDEAVESDYITIRIGEKEYSINSHKAKPRYNGITAEWELPPRVIGITAYVPLRAMAQLLGKSVGWNEEEQRVCIW